MSPETEKWFKRWLEGTAEIHRLKVQSDNEGRAYGEAMIACEWITSNPPGPEERHADWIVRAMNHAHRAIRAYKKETEQ